MSGDETPPQEKIASLARQILSLTTRSDEQDRPTRPDGATLLEVAQCLYQVRRKREHVFGHELFSDPATDILLDLFVAHETNKVISVTSASLGAQVPVTTGLRWLKLLEERGLILREVDTSDARRSNVRLSDSAVEKMRDYLGALFTSIRAIGPTVSVRDLDDRDFLIEARRF